MSHWQDIVARAAAKAREGLESQIPVQGPQDRVFVQLEASQYLDLEIRYNSRLGVMRFQRRDKSEGSTRK